MEDGFDVVRVRVEHERCVVAGVVLRALTGRAVVGIAGLGREPVKGCDCLLVVDAECQVDVFGRFAARMNVNEPAPSE